jgi:hypothetical protein
MTRKAPQTFSVPFSLAFETYSPEYDIFEVTSHYVFSPP